jgi:hypothetical protein
MHKTLVGKDTNLFLLNDSHRELDIHCNNLNLVKDKTFSRYCLENFLLIVFPDKSVIYKDYLPDNFVSKYRPALHDYTKVFKNKLIDTYEVLKNEPNIYYKTDTHINMKGAYIVYKHFLNKINEIYNLHFEGEQIEMQSIECFLKDAKLANNSLGDLLHVEILDEYLLPHQMKDENTMELFYYSNDIEYIYTNHIIQKDDTLRILNKEFEDKNEDLCGSIVDWHILSNYILYRNNGNNENNEKHYKVIIFYDSFLSSTLDLYLKLFKEVYMIKDVYSEKYIDHVKPDYVFEFRVERFLV